MNIYIRTFLGILLLIQFQKVNCQVVPDGDMENWNSFTVDTRFYEEPASGWWASLNSLSRLAPIAPITVSKVSGSEAYSGNSAKLVTRSFVGMKIPGLLCAAVYQTPSLTTPTQTLIYGKPFSFTPSTLKMYYKYLPVNSDSFGIYILLYRYNSALHQRDTIADLGYTGGSTPDWTLLQENLHYYLPGIVPDSIIFNISSSAKANILNGGEDGSTLYVDDIFLEDFTGIQHAMHSDISLSISPNPAENFINIQINHFEKNYNAIIYSNTGQKMASFPVTDNNVKHSISSYPKGVYHLNLLKNKVLLHTASFTKL